MGKVVRCEPWGTDCTDIHFLCAFGAALLVKEYYPHPNPTPFNRPHIPTPTHSSHLWITAVIQLGIDEQDFLDAFPPFPYKRVVCLSALIMLADAHCG